MGYDRLCKGRVSLRNQIYLVTAVTAQRCPWFEQFTIGRLVVHEMRALHDANAVDSIAWVLMPDHLHWLFQLGASHSLQEVMRCLKARSALTLNRALERSGAIWQRGFHDHALRNEEDLKDAARYVVANPVRAGLVRSLRDYSLWDAKWL